MQNLACSTPTVKVKTPLEAPDPAARRPQTYRTRYRIPPALVSDCDLCNEFPFELTAALSALGLAELRAQREGDKVGRRRLRQIRLLAAEEFARQDLARRPRKGGAA